MMRCSIAAVAALALTTSLGCSNARSEVPVAQSVAFPNQLPTVVEVSDRNVVIVQEQGQQTPVTLTCVAIPPQSRNESNLLTELLPAGQAVQVRAVKSARSGQTSAELFLGNEPVGVRLIREGAAIADLTTFTDCPETASRYWQAQLEAQQDRKGVWQQYDLHSAASIDMQPNVALPVQATAGNCPEILHLWAIRQGFEGGADHTVIVDTPSVASAPAQQATGYTDEVVFVAPLRPEYTQCTGVARSDQLAMYQVKFGEGQLRFSLNLQGQGSRQVLYAGLSASRPYIHWRATE